MTHRLKRISTARILQSLIEAEVKALRNRPPGATPVSQATQGMWSCDLSFTRDQAGSLGLDSLEMMAIGAAINEMFHLYEDTSARELTEMETFGDWLDAIQAAWDHGVSKITFLTSGSTGIPKRCVHELASLVEEAAFLAQMLSSRRRIIALAPAHHIYGSLLIAFVAEQLELEVVPGSVCSPRFLNTELRSGDLVVSFPERWAALDRTVSIWPADIDGIVSTAPCPPSLIASLYHRGLAGMTELYGSTETAGIGWRKHPASAFALMPHWSFSLPDDELGDGSIIRHRDGRIVASPDALQKLNAREFTVGIRRDGAVQVGGINVWPQRIAAELVRHPKVKAASVRFNPTSAGGYLKAFIVPVSPEPIADFRAELEVWFLQRLSPAECPRHWSFGGELPVNEQGKAADW